MVSAPEFQTKLLRRAANPDEFLVYRAGLEWDLVDPIVIETRKDLKSEKRWQGKVEPYHHQVKNLITFCRRLPVTLLADDVGLGKTISAGLVASELIARARVSRTLIVCPKLLGPQWKDELEQKFDIPAEVAIGREVIAKEPPDGGALITTYASARLHLENIPENRFQLLVLDEAHKLRNLYGVDPAPQVALRFQKALEQRRFRYVLMLTATPIQNRLWDLYSLVDLLTAARGHQNPFGGPGMFARKFIAGSKEEARQLRPEAREEFRSIVYGYMSRVRRGDAKLYFPERKVQLHRVAPTAPELQLIATIAKPIQKLNRLAQISILQALTSSPHALMAQLNTMADNRTVPAELAAAVRSIVSNMTTSAKLTGLGTLVDRLTAQNPERWRMVVFTGRRETQTTIQSYLEERGLRVGIINGSSGHRNQETIARFKKNPPDHHVIVSTEAGSEGVNLQVANVLVNYDLPWNPMIVEQRIGRIQRLASEHATVSILNIILKGTFEEYIVGRLMEKLQMASHAIGDIEALLEVASVDDDDEDAELSFDERILQLVLAALEGKDIQAATQQAEQSILDAKTKLEDERENINSMLGSMEGAEYVGPRPPQLPPITRSMEAKEFILKALKSLGAEVEEHGPDKYLIEDESGREWIRLDEEQTPGSQHATLYAPGTAAFARLVDRVVASGLHQVEDGDSDPASVASDLAKNWVLSFGATPIGFAIANSRRCYEGHALIKARATVAHDSCERLVDVACDSAEHRSHEVRSSLYKLPDVIDDAHELGIDNDRLADVALRDPGISDFCRFYRERGVQEIAGAGDDPRKRKKLEDDFEPRLALSVVGLTGIVHREIIVDAQYRFGDSPTYTSKVTVSPRDGRYIEAPELSRCSRSGSQAPIDCLERCAISGAAALRHLLVSSESSQRRALPEHSLTCSLSGKRILEDEAEVSAVTERKVLATLLKRSQISGKRAEPEHIARCDFTGVDALNTELGSSQISGRRYRLDEQARSVVSNRAGHKTEFLLCHETRQPLVADEAEKCERTGALVRPGVLQRCAVSGMRVLPSELDRCVATDSRVLRGLLVASNLSGARVQREIAVRSIAGNFCLPAEARACIWSGRRVHPDDLRMCALTGVTIHVDFCSIGPSPHLQPLADLLNGLRRTNDMSGQWSEIASAVVATLRGGRVRIEAAAISPDRRLLAISAEVRTMMGLRLRQAGLLYAFDDRTIVGRIAMGKRAPAGWTAAA